MWSGDWGRVRGFVEILILQGVRGLGPEIENVNIWEGVRGQRLGILYFGSGGSVRGVWGQKLGNGDVNIGGGGGGGWGQVQGQIWGMFILWGGGVLGQTLEMLIL